MKKYIFGLVVSSTLGYGECALADSLIMKESPPDLTSMTLINNQAAYIPAQCYTKAVDEKGNVHNPCMACHKATIEPNYRQDNELQLSYAFSDYTSHNHWSNLFKDRTEQISKVTDASILDYVRQNNYQSHAFNIDLVDKLKHLPMPWDYDKNGNWSGFYPDCFMNFDQNGFDHDSANQYTGWRAFAYTPFLGTFWPTNGSTDDVIIRLAPALRQNNQGQFDVAVYKINLAIVESLILRKNIAIDPVDETLYGIDLNKDGKLNNASQVTFDWSPNLGRNMSYIGAAKAKQLSGELHLAAGLFPEGTEFLHSVRYLDIDQHNQVTMASRMKELRYSRKVRWLTYMDLKNAAIAEVTEKVKFPERLRQIIGNVEDGMSNGQGWVYQGFIEDRQGELRPQTYEEMTACMGCHGGIGATTDSNFSFPRKLDASHFQQGWFHWSQRGLVGINEPKLANGIYEYANYLSKNQAGDEFRENREVKDRFFDKNNQLKSGRLSQLHEDISLLLLPTKKRALLLNKAYQLIVEEQSFIHGRDPVIQASKNVYQSVEPNTATGFTQVEP